MSVLTQAIYDVLSGDATLTALLSTYEGAPAIFTVDPAPEGATLPYIVSAGEVTQLPWDTKQTRGRDATRDVRCYTSNSGSADVVESIAERVRGLLHRQAISMDDYDVIVADCSGPIVADEKDAYGRVVSVRLRIEQEA